MSWQTLALGDVCDVIGGGTPSKRCADFYEGNIPWASIRDMQGDWVESTEFSITEKAVASSATNVIPSDNVIIATRVGLGKVARLRRDTAINQDIRAVVPRDDRKLDKQYLFYWFKSIAEIIESEGKGATVKGVTLPFVKSLQLPLPSIAEQHRIVAILDEAFAGIATAKANAKKNLNNAQDLVSRLIEDLFPQDGDGSGEHSLVELCESIVDCEHRTAPTQEEGIPSIRTPNIGRGVLLLDGVNRVSEATYMEWTRRAEPKPGDLILAREAPAGNIAVIPEGMRVCLGQRTVLLRPRRNVFESAYLAHLLLQRNSQKRLLAHSRGATVQHINVKDIREFKVASVPPMAQQRTVVAQVQTLVEQEEVLVDLYTRKLAALDELKQSLLHQAFSGQL